jgi:uncharacterized protein YodC (DUF2158 family)
VIDRTVCEKFPLGTKVKLNVGGPDMAVKRHADAGPGPTLVVCQWFDGGKLEEGQFAPETLIAVSSQTAPAP